MAGALNGQRVDVRPTAGNRRITTGLDIAFRGLPDATDQKPRLASVLQRLDVDLSKGDGSPRRVRQAPFTGLALIYAGGAVSWAFSSDGPFFDGSRLQKFIGTGAQAELWVKHAVQPGATAQFAIAINGDVSFELPTTGAHAPGLVALDTSATATWASVPLGGLALDTIVCDGPGDLNVSFDQQTFFRLAAGETFFPAGRITPDVVYYRRAASASADVPFRLWAF